MLPLFSAANSVDTVYLCTRSELDSLFFFFFFFSTWFCGHSISLYTKRVWVWSLLLLLFSAVGSVDTAYLCDCSPPLLEEQVAKYTINLFCTSEAPDSSPPPLAVLCNEKYFNQVIE